MRKNATISTIRAAKPYRKIMKATQENATKKIFSIANLIIICHIKCF